jgi:hypothetical protein
MNWYRLIGVDDKVLANVDPQHNERQSYILSMIGIMITVIPIICFLSSIVLAAPVFQSWIVGIFIGIFLSSIINVTLSQLEQRIPGMKFLISKNIILNISYKLSNDFKY